MRWLVCLLVLLAARNVDAGTTVCGKVVAVPDGTSLWVFLEQAQASYHITLAELPTAPPGATGDQSARDWLSRSLLGQQVQVVVPRLNDRGGTSGQVYFNGQSVNRQIASLLLGGTPVAAAAVSPAPAMPVYEYQPRPLFAFCSTLRLLLTGREGHFHFAQDSSGSR